MAPKDLNAFLTFVYAAQTANQQFAPYSCPKSVEQLSIAKSYKYSAKMIFAIQ